MRRNITLAWMRFNGGLMGRLGGFIRRAIVRGWQRPRIINRLLYPLALGYDGGMRVRQALYRRGILRSRQLPVPVVVVGNLSLGGVGKTPLVIALVGHLQGRGMRPGVVSRGYGRDVGRGGAGVAGFGGVGADEPDEPGDGGREVGADSTAAQVGDEPLLIFRRCRAPVMVGANRYRNARWLIAKRGCDIIISDDGFQHLKLRRNLDIVVVDGARPFGNGWCLPAGPLRESPAALNRAGMVVANVAVAGDSIDASGLGDADGGASADGRAADDLGGKGDSGDVAADSDGSGHTDRHESAPPIGAFVMRARLRYAQRLGRQAGDHASAERRELSAFAGKSVHAVAGIGHPQRFFRHLAAHGISAAAHIYPDHHPFTAPDFAFADAATTVLMTEKDAVKCEPLLAAGALCGEYWALPLELTLSPGLMPAVFERLGLSAGE